MGEEGRAPRQAGRQARRRAGVQLGDAQAAVALAGKHRPKGFHRGAGGFFIQRQADAASPQIAQVDAGRQRPRQGPTVGLDHQAVEIIFGFHRDVQAL